MNESINKVRSDLKKIKKNSLCISSLLRYYDLQETRIKSLRSRSIGKDKCEKTANTLQKSLEKIELNKIVCEAELLKQSYIQFIKRLDLIHKTVVMSAFFQGKPYWKIGKEIGYSERSIRYIIESALKQIAEEKEKAGI